MAAILGRKLGMTQIFDGDGNIVPVTVVEAGPCVVVGVRTPAKEGYAAVQLGFDPLPEKPRVRAPQKPYRGVFLKRGLAPMRVIREVRLGGGETFELGQAVRADAFSEGARVDVTGVSKGKGFAGAIKRHNFGGQRDSHGVSLMHRAIGSIGSSNIARVWKGKRMPGRLGGERATVRGLRVVSVDAERNVLLIHGAVPGPRGSVLLVKTAAPRKSLRAAPRRAQAEQPQGRERAGAQKGGKTQ
ncbi:MAG TPA: 50S ribosomal protein L3 [bacterium]|nr:50S ribosomal protein L3 [bacterium]